MQRDDTDVLVIGAGPGGATAGAILASRGRRILCLERQYFPRHVIGESLLPRCNVLLREAGLLSAVEARGFMVKHGAEFRRGDARVRFDFSEGLRGEPPTSFQTPRALFDQTLATQARQRGVDLRFGHAVEGIDFSTQGARVRVKDLEAEQSYEVRARFVLDCSGRGRVLARLLDLEEAATLAPKVALFTMVEGDRRPAGKAEGDIWICVDEAQGWSWTIPFSDGRTSVGFVARPQVVDEAKGSQRDKLLELLRREPGSRLRHASSVPVMPTQRVQSWTRVVKAIRGESWALVGNAGNFLDPIFSSGVMLALESATLAADAVDRQLGEETVDWEEDYARVVHKATGVFQAFVESWYRGELERVFLAEAKSDSIRRSIVSILGGHVRNDANALVRSPRQGLAALLGAIDGR